MSIRYRILAAALAAAVVLQPAAASAGPSAEPSDDLDPREPSARSVVYRNETVIRATPARIWDILVDLPRYAEWNPWVVRAGGDLRRGGAAWAEVKMGGITMKADHTVLVVDRERRFCWRDAGWNARFVYGQRCRTLTAQPDGGVLVTQEVLLDGALSGVAALAFGKALADGIAAENAALRRHAEGF